VLLVAAAKFDVSTAQLVRRWRKAKKCRGGSCDVVVSAALGAEVLEFRSAPHRVELQSLKGNEYETGRLCGKLDVASATVGENLPEATGDDE
jgi:hypothetical protein